MSFYTFLAFFLYFITLNEGAPVCTNGYTCFDDPDSDIVWVRKNDGNTNGPSCQAVCEAGLVANSDFYTCDHNVDLIRGIDALSDISEGLGFNCSLGGCWSGVSPQNNAVLVSKGDDTSKKCYFPQDASVRKFSCTDNPGNANCFGERYSMLCPCVSKPLDEACYWDDPSNQPQTAVWGNYETGTSCIDRINYWRRRACDEGWYECPVQGLPPMVECTCCHECANSQSEYDRIYGAHKSFTRCGDMVQGSGGGATCADVIDAFVSERAVDPNDGIMKCQGHCGPIVASGCNTFFWGRSEPGTNFYTLNWRTCNVEKCNDYCENPNSNECFTLDDEFATDTSNCGADDDDETTTADPTQRPTERPIVTTEEATPSPEPASTICNDGYSCYSDPDRDIVWVKRDAGNVWSPNCESVCENGIGNVGTYGCNENTALIRNTDDFENIAEGLGFSCTQGWGCWSFASPNSQLVMVTRGDSTNKTCYFPQGSDTTFSCSAVPGNANCFGERYSTICPCDTGSGSSRSSSNEHSNNNNNNNGISTAVLAVIITCAALLLILIAGIVYWRCYYKKDNRVTRKNTELSKVLLENEGNTTVVTEKGN